MGENGETTWEPERIEEILSKWISDQKTIEIFRCFWKLKRGFYVSLRDGGGGGWEGGGCPLSSKWRLVIPKQHHFFSSKKKIVFLFFFSENPRLFLHFFVFFLYFIFSSSEPFFLNLSEHLLGRVELFKNVAVATLRHFLFFNEIDIVQVKTFSGFSGKEWGWGRGGGGVSSLSNLCHPNFFYRRAKRENSLNNEKRE